MVLCGGRVSRSFEPTLLHALDPRERHHPQPRSSSRETRYSMVGRGSNSHDGGSAFRREVLTERGIRQSERNSPGRKRLRRMVWRRVPRGGRRRAHGPSPRFRPVSLRRAARFPAPCADLLGQGVADRGAPRYEASGSVRRSGRDRPLDGALFRAGSNEMTPGLGAPRPSRNEMRRRRRRPAAVADSSDASTRAARDVDALPDATACQLSERW